MSEIVFTKEKEILPKLTLEKEANSWEIAKKNGYPCDCCHVNSRQYTHMNKKGNPRCVAKTQNLGDESSKFWLWVHKRSMACASPSKLLSIVSGIKNLKTHVGAQAGYESLFVEFLEMPKSSKFVYKKLISIQSEQLKEIQENWFKDIGLNHETVTLGNA